MNFEEFMSDVPLRNSIEFASAEESEETLRSMDIEQPLRQLGRGEFRYRIAARPTPEADFYADRFSVAVSMHLDAPADMVGMLFPRSAGGRFLASGDQTRDEKLIVIPGGSGADIVGDDLIGSESILISKLRFDELLDVLCPAPRLPATESLTIVPGDVSSLHAMRRMVRTLAAYPELDPGSEHRANLVAAAIDWLGCHSRGWEHERLCGNAAPARVAKLARQHIEDHYRDAIRIENLCRTTNVSARTLQRCFREYFGLTISDYVKTVRLDTARRELITVEPELTSVANVAMRHGNTHLGRFSVDYRERFGESPKETLAG